MQHKETNYFIELHELIDEEFYNYYKEHRTHTSKGIGRYTCFVRAVGGFFKELKRINTETTGGVDIRGFGYFCYVKSKTKRKKLIEKNPLKKHLRNNRFDFWFYPEKDLREWYLDPTKVIFKKLNHYIVTPESAKIRYEMEDLNKRLINEAKSVKFIQ
jgi:phage pi2 protein 07